MLATFIKALRITILPGLLLTAALCSGQTPRGQDLEVRQLGSVETGPYGLLGYIRHGAVHLKKSLGSTVDSTVFYAISILDTVGQQDSTSWIQKGLLSIKFWDSHLKLLSVRTVPLRTRLPVGATYFMPDSALVVLVDHEHYELYRYQVLSDQWLPPLRLDGKPVLTTERHLVMTTKTGQRLLGVSRNPLIERHVNQVFNHEAQLIGQNDTSVFLIKAEGQCTTLLKNLPTGAILKAQDPEMTLTLNQACQNWYYKGNKLAVNDTFCLDANDIEKGLVRTGLLVDGQDSTLKPWYLVQQYFKGGKIAFPNHNGMQTVALGWPFSICRPNANTLWFTSKDQIGAVSSLKNNLLVRIAKSSWLPLKKTQRLQLEAIWPMGSGVAVVAATVRTYKQGSMGLQKLDNHLLIKVLLEK